MTTLKQEICERIDALPPEDQRKVLDLARTLAERKTAGVKGRDLLPFTKGFPKEDVETMRVAVEEDCERVDLSEW
ncbi:hypothetical protein JXD38_04400 [candidate division WOR-3 bacterium]|nr:hypothetical protein [candidate division WOR-3 bacterium]